jgi:hypothetical protein
MNFILIIGLTFSILMLAIISESEIKFQKEFLENENKDF